MAYLEKLGLVLTATLLAACPGDDSGGEGDGTDGGSTSNGSGDGSGDDGPTGDGMDDGGSGSAGSTGSADSGSTGNMGSTGDDADASSDDGSSSGGGMVTVPDPCGDVVPNFEDVEPNDTPEEAIDGCTVIDGYWGNFPLGSTLGDEDEVDWVVFATPDNGGSTVSVPIFPCWSPMVDLVDVTVYPVTDGVADLTSPVYESATPDDQCEGAYIDLADASVFLLELRLATPGTITTGFTW